MKVYRKHIISQIESAMKSNPAVCAFWLEGADAMGTVDEFSDIDVWLDVTDGHEGAVLDEMKTALAVLAPLDFSHEIDHPDAKIRQAFFHLQGTSEFLIIDVCIQSHSRATPFVKNYQGQSVKIIFDKADVVTFRDFDAIDFEKKKQARIAGLEKSWLFSQAWVKKEINRGHFLSALSYYHTFILEPLIELLRWHYTPTKHEFGAKHIEQDLPSEVVRELEDLHKINSLEEMTAKTETANILFLKTLSALKNL